MIMFSNYRRFHCNSDHNGIAQINFLITRSGKSIHFLQQLYIYIKLHPISELFLKISRQSFPQGCMEKTASKGIMMMDLKESKTRWKAWGSLRALKSELKLQKLKLLDRVALSKMCASDHENVMNQSRQLRELQQSQSQISARTYFTQFYPNTLYLLPQGTILLVLR